MSRSSRLNRSVASVLAIALTIPAWAVTGATPELPNPGSASMSRDDQQKLGLQVATDVYKQMPVLPDSSPETQYIQQLGKKLVRQIPQQYTWPYEFHVVQQKEINAFALPGGQMFVNVGTIAAAHNEAQLAGVMSHEMSHVYMQHTAKSMRRQELGQIIGALGGIFGDSAAGTLARVGAAGAGVYLLKYSRKDEAQADSVGAIIMYKAGYNPMELANFFEILAKQGGSGPQFLSDHPNPGNRSSAIAKQIRNWPPQKYVSNSETFLDAKKRASAAKAYTAQEISDGAKTGLWAKQNIESGATPKSMEAAVSEAANAGTVANVTFDQVKPSGQFTEIHQNGISISYPSNWSTASGKGSLTIAPKAGVSQNAVAYGVILSGAEDANAGSLDQVANDLIKNLVQSNPGLHQNGDLKSISVNGVSARSADLFGNSPVQQNGKPLTEHDWLVLLPRPGGTYLYMIFIAPENDFAALRPTYQKMVDSLRVE
jgi:Zn-dependent protease with chaperone function